MQRAEDVLRERLISRPRITTSYLCQQRKREREPVDGRRACSGEPKGWTRVEGKNEEDRLYGALSHTWAVARVSQRQGESGCVKCACGSGRQGPDRDRGEVAR